MNTREALNKLIESDSVAVRQPGLTAMLLEHLASDVDRRHHTELLQRIITLYAETNERLTQALTDVERLSVTDPLTQIFNRRKFMEMLRFEIQRLYRDHESLSLILFDIDHFKQVNDTYGHDAGDSVLVQLCRLVSAHVRKYDTFARWGGEEFVILMPEMNAVDALHRAEEIRRDIEGFEFSQVSTVTASLGVTTFRSDDTEDDFTKRADEALYLSKKSGRNRTTLL